MLHVLWPLHMSVCLCSCINTSCWNTPLASVCREGDRALGMSLHSVGAALHVNMNSLVGGCVFVVPRSILGVVYYFVCASVWDACRQIMMNDFILWWFFLFVLNALSTYRNTLFVAYFYLLSTKNAKQFKSGYGMQNVQCSLISMHCLLQYAWCGWSVWSRRSL